MDTWVAGAIFVVAYVLIASERVDRTLVALAAGSGVVLLGIVDQHEAFAAIDLNVIFLLVGMMILAGALARTGVFEWLAIAAARAAHGDPLRLLVTLSIVTAVLSAFLDNVTTVILITPITISVARRLGVGPRPYLISMILASNIGGTATLIGDPPNILIGSAANLDFIDFIVNLGPVAVIILVIFLGMTWVAERGHLRAIDPRREEVLEAGIEAAIKDRPALARALVVTALTMVGFLIHPILHVETATIALLGATVLMLIERTDPHEAFREIEWSTLFFFVGLFMLVEAVVAVGIVGTIADAIADWSGGSTPIAATALLWFSAIASAIIDNIPYTATAIPVVEELIASGLSAEPLWWSLALGACLGGNLTIVGASANVVVANLAGRAGHPIGFREFLRAGVPVVLMSMVVSTAYVWLRYLW